MVQPKAGGKRTFTPSRMEVSHSDSTHSRRLKRFRDVLKEGEERRDIRQHGQGLQIGTSTMKRTATVNGCQVQHWRGRCTYFPAKEVCCTCPSDHSPLGRHEWERQPEDPTQNSQCLFSLSQNLPQSSACTSMVSGQRQPAVGEQQVGEYLYMLDMFEARVPNETLKSANRCMV